MVELPALTRARQIRLACQASSRRAGWEFRRACAQASSIGHWIDEGENVLRLGTKWGGLGLSLVSLFYPGKKIARRGRGWGGSGFGGAPPGSTDYAGLGTGPEVLKRGNR